MNMHLEAVLKEVSEKYEVNTAWLRSARFGTHLWYNKARNELCYRMYTELHMSTYEISKYFKNSPVTVSRNIKRHCDIHKLTDPILNKTVRATETIIEEIVNSPDRKHLLKLLNKLYNTAYSRGYSVGLRRQEKAELSLKTSGPIPEYPDNI